jgi:AraC-like DNA-binding protein
MTVVLRWLDLASASQRALSIGDAMQQDPALSPERPLRRSRLGTDRPGEIVELTRVTTLPEAQFWRVEHSDRHWSMLHDTFTACLVRGPLPLVARWSSRGEERSIGAGGIQLMEPGEVHRTTYVSEPASFFVTWWTPGLLERAALEMGAKAPVHFVDAQSCSVVLARALEALCSALADAATVFAVESAFAEATNHLLDLASAGGALVQPVRRRHPCVHRAVEYLRAAFTQTVTLDELARETRLSKFHFARSFRATTGFAPHQYQSLLRLQAARRHLERGTSVEESAALTGFADGPHLTRAFRRWVGVSPGSWARAARCFAPMAALSRG